MSTLVFKVDTLEHKKTQKGKGFIRLKIEGGPWVSVWTQEDAKVLTENPDATFKGDIEQDGDFKNLTNVALAGAESPSNGGKPSTPTQTSETDWRAKERREAFRIAVAVVYKTERDNQVTSDLALQKALDFAGKIVSASEGWAASLDAPFS